MEKLSEEMLNNGYKGNLVSDHKDGRRSGDNEKLYIFNEKWHYFPTLSELIEACGENFDKLVRSNDYETKPMWRAHMTEEAFDKTGIDCVRDCDGYEIGKTPEEAVANLWLALQVNKNKDNVF